MALPHNVKSGWQRIAKIVLIVLLTLFAVFCCLPVLYVIQVQTSPIWGRLDGFQVIKMGHLPDTNYSIEEGQYQHLALRNETTSGVQDLGDIPYIEYLLLHTQSHLYFIAYNKNSGWFDFTAYDITTVHPRLVSENFSCNLPAYRNGFLEFLWEADFNDPNADIADACGLWWPDPNNPQNWDQVRLE
ncbi:MAG TPA: hypothetical protein VKQ72_09660 [Aggregatilineales bacterium]|nr:hypothetical protein [Aggregatilineales bacterium]